MPWRINWSGFFQGVSWQGSRCTDDRVLLIEKVGQITPKALSEKFGISGAAVTQWMRSWIEKGVLVWCNANGAESTDVAELERAKRSGRAFVKVAGGMLSADRI